MDLRHWVQAEKTVRKTRQCIFTTNFKTGITLRKRQKKNVGLKEGWRKSVKLLLGITEPFANILSQQLWVLLLSTIKSGLAIVQQESGKEPMETHFLLLNGWFWTVLKIGIVLISKIQRTENIEDPCLSQ